MPGQQRRRCDEEGPPACAREEPAGCREKDPVGRCHPRTVRSSSEDGELMPQHDDFELLEIGRANAQGDELKHPAQHLVTEREEHEASRSRDSLRRSTHRPPDARFHVAPRRTGYETWINAPFRPERFEICFQWKSSLSTNSKSSHFVNVF